MVKGTHLATFVVFGAHLSRADSIISSKRLAGGRGGVAGSEQEHHAERGSAPQAALNSSFFVGWAPRNWLAVFSSHCIRELCLANCSCSLRHVSPSLP